MHEFFQFSLLLDAVNAIGSTAMMAALFFYLPRKENIGFRMETPWIQKTMRFMGSRTLEIYVVHLLLFKAAFAYLCGCTHCSCYLGSIANLLS